MRIVDFYPSQGSYCPDETVTLLVELETSLLQDLKLQIVIQHLTDRPILIDRTLQLEPGERTVQVHWMPPSSSAGYSARVEIFTGNHASTLQATTAFDVLAHWTDFPRYGFLTDFSASRGDPDEVLEKLTRFHINGLQFYDWQYRHDQLLAPSEDYVDPLGRKMSLTTVRTLVDAAHKHGMAAMPYLAIYAASTDFWRAHPDWALFDEAGNPVAFGENFLGLMDPSINRPWSQHLLSEAARTLQSIPFDGLHIDQYGDPKHAWDSHHNPLDLPRAFVDFIQSASDQHPDKTILFNAVGNWPIESLSASAVDFMYIEVWPPDVEYRQLAEIVLNAVRLSSGKAVVIAIYLPANRPANNLLVDAVILACGGTRIELGEDARLLSDPYFPKHEEISSDLYTELRKFSDFAVRNGEWIKPYTLSAKEKELWSEVEFEPKFISIDSSVWTVVRRFPKSFVFQLVNFNGLDLHQRWDEAHVVPQPCQNLSVKIEMSQRPAQVLWDSPENSNGAQKLSFEHSDGILIFQIPQINLTGLVAIHE